MSPRPSSSATSIHYAANSPIASQSHSFANSPARTLFSFEKESMPSYAISLSKSPGLSTPTSHPRPAEDSYYPVSTPPALSYAPSPTSISTIRTAPVVPSSYCLPQRIPKSGSYSDMSFSEQLINLLTPECQVIDMFHALPDWHVTQEISIPMSYIRAQISNLGPDMYMDHASASHYIRVSNMCTPHFDRLLYPVHDVVLLAQCAKLPFVAIPQNQKGSKPTLVIPNLPHLSSFSHLLRWLYTNDEHDLYNDLAEATEEEGSEFLRGFAENVSFLGIVSSELIGVVRAVLEGNDSSDSE